MAKKYFNILDIGGTKILSILTDCKRNIIYREIFPTKEGKDPEALISQINDTVKFAGTQIPRGDTLAGIGICIAAFVNYREGTIYGAPNLPLKEKFPLKKVITEKWQIPVIMENDANAAVLGEVRFGAARGFYNVIYVTVSTGIGGGLFLDGKLYRGRDGFAGEIGHMKLSGNTEKCGCGKTGCLESIASGSSMARIGHQSFGNNIAAGELFAARFKGDKKATFIVDNALKNIGITLANVITLLNLDCVVIGGGVTNAGDVFFSEIQKYIQDNLSIKGTDDVKLVKATLEPESGVWGVYSLLKTTPGGDF